MALTIGYGSGDSPLALIITDHGAGAADAATAIALAGQEFRGVIDWAAAGADRLDSASAEMIAIEAEGVAPAILATALPYIAAVVDRTRSRAVVALDPEQIDIVAAALLGPRVELLCSPTVAERAAAFAIALGPFASNRLHAADEDSESAQLRQLNEEVARIAKVLAQLTADGRRPPASRASAYEAPPAVLPETAVTVTASDVRKLIRARRMRGQYIAENLFEDPAWDMMLDLYAADLENAQVSVSSLCIAAAVAPTTALRWITRLTEAGMFERHPDPFDKRRAFLTLTDLSRSKLQRYFAALRQAGFLVL